MPNLFYSIRRELIDIFSIIVYFPSTSALMMARSRAESSWEISNYGTYIT